MYHHTKLFIQKYEILNHNVPFVENCNFLDMKRGILFFLRVDKVLSPSLGVKFSNNFNLNLL